MSSASTLRSSHLLRLVVAPGGAVVLLLVWWFAWMAPAQHKLASVRAQSANDRIAIVALQNRLASLRSDQQHARRTAHLLTDFKQAIPTTPEAPELVVQVYRLATAHGVKLESITDNAVTPTSAGYSTIPVTMEVSGTEAGVAGFLSGLYQLPRLVTVQQLTLSSGSGGNVVARGSAQMTASIDATAYTTARPAAGATTGTATSALSTESGA